jgi:hypothetical protein
VSGAVTPSMALAEGAGKAELNFDPTRELRSVI